MRYFTDLGVIRAECPGAILSARSSKSVREPQIKFKTTRNALNTAILT